MVDTNIKKCLVSFRKSVSGMVRLMSQLRGIVMLCSTPPQELTLWAMMNCPESLSTRSHNAIRSACSQRRRTLLRGKIRGGPRGFIYLAIRTVDTVGHGSTKRAPRWARRGHVRREPYETRIEATVPSCTSAQEEWDFRHTRGHNGRLEPILVRS